MLAHLKEKVRKMIYKALFLLFNYSNGEMMADNLSTKRHFENVYVCQTCNATNRGASGKPPKCRKCQGKRLRLKKKKKKSSV